MSGLSTSIWWGNCSCIEALRSLTQMQLARSSHQQSRGCNIKLYAFQCLAWIKASVSGPLCHFYEGMYRYALQTLKRTDWATNAPTRWISAVSTNWAGSGLFQFLPSKSWRGYHSAVTRNYKNLFWFFLSLSIITFNCRAVDVKLAFYSSAPRKALRTWHCLSLTFFWQHIKDTLASYLISDPVHEGTNCIGYVQDIDAIVFLQVWTWGSSCKPI